MKIGRAALPFPTLIGAAVLAFGLLGARSAWACRSDEECKSPRVCVMGACVNPPEPTAASCERDIDCGGADVCEAHRCVPMMNNIPSELPSPELEMGPHEVGDPAPGMQITPHKAPEGAPTTQPQPAQPAPAAPPPPPRTRPPRPPPDAYITAPPEAPPPPPTSPYAARRVRPLMTPRFDIFGGLGFLFLESPYRSTTALGLGLDAQFVAGVAPSLALGIRVGGVLVLEPRGLDLSMAYVAPGVVIPEWHTGLFIGAASARAPFEKRLGGVQFDIPYEYAFAPFLKMQLIVGLGIFPGINPLYERTLRIEFGF